MYDGHVYVLLLGLGRFARVFIRITNGFQLMPWLSTWMTKTCLVPAQPSQNATCFCLKECNYDGCGILFSKSRTFSQSLAAAGKRTSTT